MPDARLALPPSHAFRFLTPDVALLPDTDKVSHTTFRTSREIETERLAAKRTN